MDVASDRSVQPHPPAPYSAIFLVSSLTCLNLCLIPGEQWELVFSDEFEQDGRSFFPGDDPYWEAVGQSLQSTPLLASSAPPR